MLAELQMRGSLRRTSSASAPIFSSLSLPKGSCLERKPEKRLGAVLPCAKEKGEGICMRMGVGYQVIYYIKKKESMKERKEGSSLSPNERFLL